MIFLHIREKKNLCTECGKNEPNREIDSYLICDECREKMNIPYLKPTSEKKTEKIGNIRI